MKLVTARGRCDDLLTTFPSQLCSGHGSRRDMCHSHYEEHGDTWFSAVADDDNMRGVTGETIRAGKDKEIETMLTSFNQGTPVTKPIRARDIPLAAVVLTSKWELKGKVEKDQLSCRARFCDPRVQELGPSSRRRLCGSDVSFVFEAY